MKSLVLILILSAPGFAMNETRLSDAEISQKLVSVARDIQNQQILSGATQLQTCRDNFQNSYRPQQGSDNSQSVAALQSCLEQKIRNPEDARRIGEGLSLDTYTLNPSKVVGNVTEYLTKNLYRQLTGVDLDDQSRENRIRAMSIKNKKQVDQRVFFELYKNQVAKNALFEVSRFCFQDLRWSASQNPNSGARTFLEHWGSLTQFENSQDGPPVAELSDSGTPFESREITEARAPLDREAAYSIMLSNITGNGTFSSQSQRYSNFFQFCGKKITELCTVYENCQDRNDQGRCTSQNGAKACLTKTRLTAFRSAMKASDKIVSEFFDQNGNNPLTALDPKVTIQRFQQGENGNKSLNDLTNSASTDFFEANQNDGTQEAQNCLENGGQECDRFIVDDGSGNRILTNTELVYRAKRRAEMERVKELSGQDLETYIEENYPDLKGKSGPELMELVGKRWDARREAMLSEIQSRIVSRQIDPNDTPTAGSSDTQPDQRTERAQENARDVLVERTRLAQVVLFNNIISSTLNLQKADGTPVGRNVRALESEIERAEAANISANFENLRSLSEGGTGELSGNESITDIGFLDSFIGIPSDTTSGTRSPSPR